MGPAVNWARKEKQVRALSIPPASESPQDSTDTLHRWTERRRELLLEDLLDRLVTVIERLAAVLERRAAS